MFSLSLSLLPYSPSSLIFPFFPSPLSFLPASLCFGLQETWRICNPGKFRLRMCFSYLSVSFS